MFVFNVNGQPVIVGIHPTLRLEHELMDHPDGTDVMFNKAGFVPREPVHAYTVRQPNNGNAFIAVVITENDTAPIHKQGIDTLSVLRVAKGLWDIEESDFTIFDEKGLPYVLKCSETKEPNIRNPEQYEDTKSFTRALTTNEDDYYPGLICIANGEEMDAYIDYMQLTKDNKFSDYLPNT